MPCHETRREEMDFRFRVILRGIGRDLPVVQPKPVFSGPRPAGRRMKIGDFETFTKGGV